MSFNGIGSTVEGMTGTTTAGEARRRALRARQTIVSAEAVLAAAIHELRDEHKMSREDVAAGLGMTVHAVRTIELGTRKTSGLKGEQ